MSTSRSNGGRIEWDKASLETILDSGCIYYLPQPLVEKYRELLDRLNEGGVDYVEVDCETSTRQETVGLVEDSPGS